MLSAVIVKDTDWLVTLDQARAFRQFAYRQFGLKTRDELKANHLIHGTGPFATLKINDAARMRLYRQALRFQQKVGTIKTWAVVIDKPLWETEQRRAEVREAAWKHMIERIEAFTRHNHDNAIVFPDEGNPDFVRALFRKMRRFSYVPSAFEPGSFISRPFTSLIEDPSFRKSHESYFIQFADLNAYAAHRHVFPRAYFGADYWDELGDARVSQVNLLRRHGLRPTGIVVRPPY